MERPHIPITGAKAPVDPRGFASGGFTRRDPPPLAAAPWGKFVSPEAPPDGVDRELLTIFAEECCEVGQRVAKILRFGLDEVQPGQGLSNNERLAEEVGDLLGVLDLLQSRGIVPQMMVAATRLRKPAKVEQYLQSECEVLF